MRQVLLILALLLAAVPAQAQVIVKCRTSGGALVDCSTPLNNGYVNWAAPGSLGSGTPSTVRGTTVTATTQFTGSGAGLTNVPAAQISGTVPKANGGFGQDVSTGLANGFYAKVVAGALTFAAILAGDLPTGIDVAKLGTGTVTNTVFAYLANVTSDIQAQLNSLLPASSNKLPPAPTAANKLLYDTGSAYAETAACGTAGTMLIGGSPPSCSDSGSLAAQLTTPKVTSTGQLAVNAATGNNVTLGVNNTAVVTVGAAGVTVAQPLAMSSQKITGVGTPAAASTDAATAAYAEAQKTGGLVTIATFNQSNTWSANNYAGPLGMSEGGFAAASGPTPASIPVAGVLSHCYTTVRTVTSSTPVYAVHRAATGSNTYAATGITMTQASFDKWTFDNTHTFNVTAGDTFVVKNDTAYGGPGFIMQCQFVPN